MNPQHRPLPLFRALLLVCCLLLATAQAAGAPNPQTERTIRHLIGYVSGSDLTFVRNAGEYSPHEAAAHLQKKYRHFRDDIDSAEEFIALCATRSLLSGKPYQVIDRQGDLRPTADWLRTELAAYRARRQ
jgi:hypothetical protein